MECQNLADEIFSKMFGGNFEIPAKQMSFGKNVYKNSDIENVIKDIIPFVKESLLQNKLITEINGKKLSDFIALETVQFLPEYKNHQKTFVICRSSAFKFYPVHVEEVVFRMNPFLIMNYGIAVLKNTEPLTGGFAGISKLKNKQSPRTIRFCLSGESNG